jgi:hypothetical protein
MEDEHFIYHRDDFVCLTDHVEYNWLDEIVHKFIGYDKSGLLRVSPTRKVNLKYVYTMPILCSPSLLF